MTDPTRSTLAERYHLARRDPTLAVLEGLHALKHAHRFGAELLDIAVADAAAARMLAASLAPELLPVLRDARIVGDAVFHTLAPAPHATGVIAIARRREPAVTQSFASAAGVIVLLERPTHLPNIGAAVRVAAAAGATGLFALGGEDPWHPAALRGGAGLQYALPVARIAEVPECDRPLIAVDPDGESLEPGRLPGNAVLVFGSERSGISDALLARAHARVRIPMREGVSSLNLATAVAIVLYGGYFARAAS